MKSLSFFFFLVSSTSVYADNNFPPNKTSFGAFVNAHTVHACDQHRLLPAGTDAEEIHQYWIQRGEVLYEGLSAEYRQRTSQQQLFDDALGLAIRRADPGDFAFNFLPQRCEDIILELSQW